MTKAGSRGTTRATIAPSSRTLADQPATASKEINDQWFTSQQGFSVGSTKTWENHPLWQIDPVMLPFHTAVRSGRFAGYAGPSRRPAAEAISKYLLVDMYAKAVQGMPIADAVKWAHGELVKIYT